MSEQSSANLNEVQAAFSEWRARGRATRTPMELREQAVRLLERYRIGEVMRALNVDHRRLTRWRQTVSTAPTPAPAQRFIELPTPVRLPASKAPPASARLTVTRQHSDGSRVSIAGELPGEHWRWALGLLEETGR